MVVRIGHSNLIVQPKGQPLGSVERVLWVGGNGAVDVRNGHLQNTNDLTFICFLNLIALLVRIPIWLAVHGPDEILKNYLIF